MLLNFGKQPLFQDNFPAFSFAPNQSLAVELGM
jgi:hypothetical protein